MLPRHLTYEVVGFLTLLALDSLFVHRTILEPMDSSWLLF